MFGGGGRGQWRQWLQGIIQKFREKGAITPEKAMTVQELGLPPRFEQAMNRRLGQTGIFVETNGKYYLNEERLKQIQEQRSKAGTGGGSYGGGGGSPSWMRYGGLLLMAPIGIIVVVVLFFLFYFGVVSSFPGEFLIIILIVLVVLFAARLLFWSSRRRYWQERWTQNPTS